MQQLPRSHLFSTSYLQERVIELVRSIHQFHKDFFPMLRCLHAFVGKLPGYPLGKQVSFLSGKFQLSNRKGY